MHVHLPNYPIIGTDRVFCTRVRSSYPLKATMYTENTSCDKSIYYQGCILKIKEGGGGGQICEQGSFEGAGLIHVL